MKMYVLESGTIVSGVRYWQQQKGSGKGGWDQPVQRFVGQAESLTLCSESNREPSKVSTKTEE